MGRPNAAAEREYSRAYRAELRRKRDAHIDRWLDHGMSPEEIQYATGYSMGTINARVTVLSQA